MQNNTLMEPSLNSNNLCEASSDTVATSATKEGVLYI